MARKFTPALIATLSFAALFAACGGDGTTSDTEVAASTTSPSSGFPEELVDRWVGPPRTVGTLGTGTAAAFVEISEGLLGYETGIAENPKAFLSDVTVSDGVMELTLAGDVLDCLDGDLGHYRWALSPQATTLTLTAVDDTCGARQAALEGDWTHTACMVEGRDCLGIVEAGTYSTNRWNPFGGFTYGEVTFTLPDGWAVGYDSQAALFLRSAEDYAALGNDSAWGISAWADTAAALPDAPACTALSDTADPSVGTGASNIAAWMESLPSLDATRSQMTIGGLPAEVIDAKIADGAEVCDWGVILIASRTSKPDPFNFGINPGQQIRVILIDVLPDRTVAIFIDDTQHPGFEELAAVAMPIVESFVFSATPPTN